LCLTQTQGDTFAELQKVDEYIAHAVDRRLRALLSTATDSDKDAAAWETRVSEGMKHKQQVVDELRVRIQCATACCSIALQAPALPPQLNPILRPLMASLKVPLLILLIPYYCLSYAATQSCCCIGVYLALLENVGKIFVDLLRRVLIIFDLVLRSA
jgi:Domain of unknown function (DUF3535)